MRTLTIDIGTNSTLYLIADLIDGDLSVIERGIVGNRLGADKSPDGSLPAELIEENRKILVDMLARGRSQGCERVSAVGTQALRSATNKAEFLTMAESIDLDLRIIDGEEEAALAWKGVVGIAPPTQPIAILDIGGGSSELIVGKGSQIEFSQSLPIGAVTLSKQFSSDPPSKSEIARIEEYVAAQLHPWSRAVSMLCPLIGIAGTCTSLASLEKEMVDYQPGLIEGYRLSLRKVVVWKNKLLSMSLERRKALQGMPPARAEILPAGAIILHSAMKILAKNGLRVSERGLIFGLAWDVAGL